ncbi:MAG: penicillin-binding protein 2 [Balneolaceae bacterium]|nr:penicillin-binding protein 2 [Balneolaceae bacterium]
MTAHNNPNKVKTSIRVLQGIILVGFIVMIIRIFQLQILDYETYSPISMQNSLRMEVLQPARGLILDRNGTILVENQPIYSITITPSKFQMDKLPLLSKILQIDEEIVLNRIRAAQAYSWQRTSRLFTEVPFEVFSAIQENAWQLPGISHQLESKRHYPTDVQAPHIFGYLREASLEEYRADDRIRLGDRIGKSGLERSYENYLRGEIGTEYVRVNAFGQSLGTYEGAGLNVTPIRGSDLLTSIDAETQALAEKIMEGKRGGLVAMDPQTGGIIAMVSAPQFDLSKLAGRMDAEYWRDLNTNPNTPLYNRAISSRQPPGSTFKPFMGLVGLEMGLVTPQTQIYNPGFYLRGRRYNDLADPGYYDLELAIAKSSNTYFFWIMDRIASRGQLNRWAELISDFGIGPLNNIDLPSERSGIIPDSTYMNRTFGERRWGIGDLMSLGIGQGMVSASPLQMAVATSTLANGGYKVQPHVVSGIRNRDGSIEYTQPVLEKIEWVRDEDVETLKRGMFRVITEGGARWRSLIPGIDMAGKTGTSQNPHGENHGWFIAYAPMDNPQIAIAVLTENTGFGSQSAAPIASLIIEQYLTGELNRQHVLDYVLYDFPGQIISATRETGD